MQRLITIFLLVYGIICSPHATAEDLHYQAFLENSTWETQSSPLSCTLSHSIELFGKAQFYQEAGSEPGFRFLTNQAPKSKGLVTVHSRPPQWSHDKEAREIGRFNYKPSETPFTFKRVLSLRLMAELEKGMTPVFRFKDWGDGGDEVEAVLSNVRFRTALGEFRTCMNDIIPYQYAKVRNTTVYFATDKFTLTSKAKRKLDAIAAFLKKDATVKHAKVDGHADDRGAHSYNNTLSEQRAMAVQEYLLSKQVPSDKIIVRYFGKRRPVQENTNVNGRAINRRVNLTLIK
jgi:outer membrane protein OmpA-like peptidoglycan-associated protein